MRPLTFLYAVVLLALGILGFTRADSTEDIQALASPGLFFGGAVLLCAFFALREPRHGMAGASFLAFLAALTSGSKLFGALVNRPTADPEPRIALAGILFVASAAYLLTASLTWRRTRRARFRAELLGGEVD